MIDQQVIHQVKGVLANLSTPFTFIVERNPNDAKAADNSQFVEDVASCSPLLSVEYRDGNDFRFSVLHNGEPTGISFRGIPNGHEFTSLLLVLLNGDGQGRNLPDAALTQRIKALKGDIRLRTYVSLTCTNCPDVVQALNVMALLNPAISHETIDGAVCQDEVEQLNHESQTRLLSVIRRRQLKPLGYSADKPCDIRVIASTSADLLALVREKRFREDLYYALSVLPVNVPPLRERREDIPYIVTAYVAEMNKKYHQKKRFAPETIICMQSYNWPGNIRELHNVIERMMIISKNNVIQPEELPITTDITVSQKETEEYFEQVNLHKLVEQLEISYIRRAYSRYGNVRDAARSLGMDASTFVRKRKKIEQSRE